MPDHQHAGASDDTGRALLLPVGLARVHGDSMRPTLLDGDLLLVRRARTAAVGDLVLVRWPGRPLAVKRLAAEQPEGWWVERDNPVVGTDSWSIGAVPRTGLVGVVIARLWPRPGRVAPTAR